MAAVRTTIQKDKSALLTVYGQLTIQNAAQLLDAFDKLFSQDVTHYVVDLGRVAYLDSTGLSSLVQMHQRLAAVQGELKIIEVSEAAFEIFHATRLDTILPLVPGKAPEAPGE